MCNCLSCNPVAERLEAQPSCAVAPAASADTVVTFIFPNMTLNRSGPLLLTNAVRPTGPGSCAVRFDWFLDPAVAGQQDLINRVRPPDDV